MTRYLTEITSNLRGISLLILMWHSLPIEFPLDSKIKKSLDLFRADFKSIFEVIAEINKSSYGIKDLQAIFNDILDDELDYYNEETLSLTLAAYYNNDNSLKYRFYNKEQLFVETAPIFFYLLTKLINALSNSNPTDQRSSLQDERILKLLQDITMMVPGEIINSKQSILFNNISSKNSCNTNWLM